MKKLNLLFLMIILLFSQSNILKSATVVDVIVNSPDHETLETAVLAAGLEVELSGPGPFTVFAPTDAAFAALPEGALDALLADPSGDLTDILLYHVLGSSVTSGDLSDGMTAKTLLGKNIQVTIDGHNNVYINNALVTGSDIHTDNGVVHVIDAVLVPTNTVVDIIESSEDHTTLATAVDLAGLRMTLMGDGPFTVFAPTDDAFDALPEGVLDALIADPTGALADVLLYHVVGDSVVSGDLSDGQLVATLLGNKVKVTIDGGVFINDAQVIVADIEADNGVVHVLDAVLVPSNTVVDVIETSEDHMTLATAIDLAGLRMTLMGEGPFTVFAPTDDAFDALPEGLLDDLLADPSGALTEILLYHVVGDSVVSGDLSDGQIVQTLLERKDVEVTINAEGVFINDAKVIVADLFASNGVVHVIDAVLVQDTVTVVDIIVGSEDHTILETAVIAAELADDLSGEGPFTVFAPTDDAFAALPEGVLDALLADPTGALAEVLLYHVVGAEAMSGDLSDGELIATLLGNKVEVTIDGGVFINDAQVIVADIEADNGVVHVLDAVLVPSNTVVDVIETSEDHMTLATAIDLAGLRMTLMGEGPFTVFAPTDDAFAALPEGVLDALLADPTGALADVLLYHVVDAEAMSGDLSDGQLIATLLGNKVEVTIDGGVFINDAQVIVADIEADNGVVHVLDAVLVPSNTVVDVIETSDDHMTLAAAIEAAELRDALMEDGPFTVFAPTDDAFAALPEGLLDELLADPTGDLADILLYHVVSGNVMSGDLSDGMVVTTLSGQDVTVKIDGNVYINDAMVTVADLEADNGVVHVIDAVLVPVATALGSNPQESILFEVYPNPASAYINLSFSDVDFAQATIINASGAVMDRFDVSQTETTIDISTYAQGVYYMVINSENRIQTKKFIVN